MPLGIIGKSHKSMISIQVAVRLLLNAPLVFLEGLAYSFAFLILIVVVVFRFPICPSSPHKCMCHAPRLVTLALFAGISSVSPIVSQYDLVRAPRPMQQLPIYRTSQCRWQPAEKLKVASFGSPSSCRRVRAGAGMRFNKLGVHKTRVTQKV
jgi:hypothetical protein